MPEYEDEAPHVNDLTPLTGANVEPMLLIDVSTSMGESAAPGSRITRKDVIEEILPTVIEALEDEDSEAEGERAAGADEAEIGGVYTIAFSSAATDMEDLNSANIDQKMAQIPWGGGTRIVEGWNMLTGHYVQEFGDRPLMKRPKLAALIVTDGEAQDGEAFGRILADKDDMVFAVVAVIGHGKAHDATLTQYKQIAKGNNHVRVLSFDAVTSGRDIAGNLLTLLGK